MAGIRRAFGGVAPLIDRRPAACMLGVQLVVGFGVIALMSLVFGKILGLNAALGGCIIFFANALAVYSAFYSRQSTSTRFNALFRAQWIRFTVMLGGFAAVFKWLHPLRAEIVMLGFVWMYVVGWIAYIITLHRSSIPETNG